MMKAKKKSRFKKWIVFGVIIIAVAAGAVRIMRPAQVFYENVEAKTGDITTFLSFSGNVETKNRQSVMSEKVMQVSEIKVKEGDLVNEGDVLIKTTAGDEITSKISGQVVELKAEENQQVMGGVKLMDIVDYDNLEVSVKVDEYDLGALEAGREVTVNIGALKKEIKGTIRSVSKEGKVQNGVTFFNAYIDLQKDEALKIGMSAEVKLQSQRAAGVVTLPMEVVQFDNSNKPYVLKKGEKNTTVKAEITTGINDGTTVEIKDGVSGGETILYTKAQPAAGFGFGGGMGRNASRGGSN